MVDSQEVKRIKLQDIHLKLASLVNSCIHKLYRWIQNNKNKIKRFSPPLSLSFPIGVFHGVFLIPCAPIPSAS